MYSTRVLAKINNDSGTLLNGSNKCMRQKPDYSFNNFHQSYIQMLHENI